MLEKIQKQLIKPQMGRRIAMLAIAHIIMGLAIAIFNFVNLGNDPFSSMMKALTAKTPLSYGNFCALCNSAFFLIEIIWGRKYIGVGTIVNWFCLGYSVEMWNWVFDTCCTRPENFVFRLILCILAVVILGFSLSMYQSTDVGSSPFDCLPLIMNDYLHIPFFAGRVICDGGALLTCVLAGGSLGICTVFVVVGLGPIAGWFNTHVCEKMITQH